MKYRNINTGMVVDVPSKLKGCWEPLEVPAPKASVVKEKEVAQETPAPVKKPKKGK